MEKTSKILIVEDEPIVGLHLKKCLTNIGYMVVGSAQSGQQAVELAQQEAPDLVLMDIVLDGEMNGISAARIIREDLNTPIIYLTAYSDDKTLNEAKQTGPYGYLTKPFREGDLKGAIETALQKHHESAFFESRNLWYRTIFNSFFCPIIAVDKQENILLATKAMRLYCDIPPADLLGKSMRMSGIVILDENRDPVDLPLQTVISSGILQSFNRVMVKGKEKYLVNLLVCPISLKGEILGALLIFNETPAGEDKDFESTLWESRIQEYAAAIFGEGEILQICPYCKKGYDPVTRQWMDLEVYIRGKKVNDSSHHVCPSCSKNLGFDLDKLKNDLIN